VLAALHETESAVDQSLAALNSKIADDQVNVFLALGGGWETADSAPF
jgi:outer membrane protein TolC